MPEPADQPAKPAVDVEAAKPSRGRMAAWLLAEGCILSAVFSAVTSTNFSKLHWTLFDMHSSLPPERRWLYDFLDSLMTQSWLFLGLSLALFLVGVWIRPRRAALVALPFLLVALAMASIQE